MDYLFTAIAEFEYQTSENPNVKVEDKVITEAPTINEAKNSAIEKIKQKLTKNNAIGTVYINVTVEFRGEYVDSDEDFFNFVKGQLEMI